MTEASGIDRFPWIECYKELARALLTYERRQPELIECLRSLGEPPRNLKVISLQDDFGHEKRQLEAIDPFTVFAAFNRSIAEGTRREIVGGIQRFLGLPESPPENFDGVPLVNNMASWFFPYATRRDPDDIPSLWRLARQAVEGGLVGVDGATFDRCLGIRTVGMAKLTMGLFWMRPDEFMPCDGNSRKLFEDRGLGVPRDFEAYRRLVNRLREETGRDFAALSYSAWADRDSEPESLEELRGSRERCREIIEALYPDAAVRAAILRILAAGIRRTHAYRADGWCVVIRRARGFIVRLNVGNLLVTELRHGALGLGVIWSDLAEATRAKMESWIDIPPGDFSVRERGSALVAIPAEELLGLPGDMRREVLVSRDDLIDRLGASSRTPYRHAHSPGVLDYMREELGEDIPNPDYGRRGEDPWDEFVRWGSEIYRSPAAMEAERPYKLEIARNVHAVLEALEDPPEVWLPLLRRAFGAPNNITFYMDHQRLVEWATQQPEQARSALRALWDEDRELAERIDRFSALVPSSVLRAVGSRTNIASLLLSGLGAETHPPFQSMVYAKGYDLTAFGSARSDASPGAHYDHALRFLDRMMAEFRARDVPLDDRLDAQSVLWCLAKTNRDSTYVAPEHLEDLLRYVGEAPAVWWLIDEKSETALVEPEAVWVARERLGEEALAPDLRLEHLREDEVVLRVDGDRIWGISAVRQKARDARRPGGGNGEKGRRVRLDTLRLAQPIELSEIPRDARQSEMQAFDEDGEPRPGLLFRLSAEFSAHLRERFADRFPEESPWAPVRRNFWLFQSNPEQWSLAAWLRDRQEGDEGEHSVRAHWDEIRPGDRVVLWQSGPEAGAYALGEVTSEVIERTAGERPAGRGGDTRAEHIVRFRLTQKLDPPLLRSAAREHETLSGLDVIQRPSGTNYRMTPEQWKAVEDHIGVAPLPRRTKELKIAEIHREVQRHGLRISERTLRRFHHALKTRGFVIMCGPSGTGKTWLAECYAEAIGAECRLVPVAPSWTSNEDLLGHWNPLDGQYHHTEFSRFLRRAAEEASRAEEAGQMPRLHVVILDEMNLARVEHYFAEFLSKMEVRARKGRARIPLGPQEETFLTPNLLFVGTVNVDETTHGFANKVYDRAQVLELGIERDELAAHLEGQPHAEALLRFWETVEAVSPFAYRVADEIRLYVDAAVADQVAWEDALDEQLLQKVLPQLSGASPQLGQALQQIVDLAGETYPLTRRKAERMLAEFQAHGFASYF